MGKIKEYLKSAKPDFSDKKQVALFIVKIVGFLLFTTLFIFSFVFNVYTSKGHIAPKRLIISIIVYLLGSIIIFIPIKLSNKANIIVSILLSVFAIVENYAMLQFSQTFAIFNIRFIFIVFNLFVIATIFMVVFAIFNSFKVAIISITILTMFLGIIDFYVATFRGPGIIAADFINVGTAVAVMGGYSYAFDFRLFLFLMVSLVVIFMALKLGKNTLKKVWFRVVTIVVAIAMLFVGYNRFFMSNHYDHLLKVKYYRPQTTYSRKGMYISFLKTIKDINVKKPEGYSVDKVEKLADKYKGTRGKLKQEDKPNIIVIMDEAYNDFSYYVDLKINKDNLPFIHSLKDNIVSGMLFTPVYGGGTVSTEFEALTSNPMAFIPNGITAYTTYIHGPMESMASNLKEQGYGKAIAMHPFVGKDYNRDKVFNYFGFDEYLDITSFPSDAKKLGPFISDEANMDKIISEYEKYQKTDKTGKPMFVFNITMQNHSPFLNGNIPGDYKLSYDKEYKQAEEYMNLLKHTDDAVKKLINYFKKQDEKTVILFFGDHQPKLEEDFYNQIIRDSKLTDEQKKIGTRFTQYFIWANYDIKDKKNYDISSNYLESVLFDTVGLSKTGYQQMASDIQKKVPMLTIHGYIGDNGRWYDPTDNKSPYYKTLLNYNIAEYNNMIDTRHRVEEFFKIIN